MARLGSELILGATLFATPAMKGGVQIPVLMSLLAALLVLVLLLLLRRGGSRPGRSDPDPGDGWGNGPEPPDAPRPERPRGGIPLDDASQARVRLRGKGRLTDKLPARVRRPGREPDRSPVRENTPT